MGNPEKPHPAFLHLLQVESFAPSHPHRTEQPCFRVQLGQDVPVTLSSPDTLITLPFKSIKQTVSSPKASLKVQVHSLLWPPQCLFVGFFLGLCLLWFSLPDILRPCASFLISWWTLCGNSRLWCRGPFMGFGTSQASLRLSFHRSSEKLMKSYNFYEFSLLVKWGWKTHRNMWWINKANSYQLFC